jgi:hypothetical protein
MKTHCLLRRSQCHTTAWVSAELTKLGWLVEIPELGGQWEIVEIYPYRLTKKQLQTRKTLIVPYWIEISAPNKQRALYTVSSWHDQTMLYKAPAGFGNESEPL